MPCAKTYQTIDKHAGYATHLFAYAAEGAGGGVFPVETREKEPVLSEADRDIIALNEMDAIRYY